MLTRRVGPGNRLGRPFSGAGCSTKASRLTSRQPPQVAEMARNSDSIQSAAALMPWPGGRSVFILESVLRVPKLTSFAMSARTLSGEMVRRAAAMAGSVEGGARGSEEGLDCPEAGKARLTAVAPRARKRFILRSPNWRQVTARQIAGVPC